MTNHHRYYYGILLFVLFIVFCIPFSIIQARQNGRLDVDEIDAFLQKQVNTNRIPGLSVAIVKGEEVIFQKGYGEAHPGKPVTPQTQFYLGSVTKQFTAMAVMRLVEQGKIDLDAPVKAYLPWFEVADTQASSKITVRQLLNHTSGLSELGDPNSSVNASSLEEQARLLKYVQSYAPPGTHYMYYNQNYRLLGLLIEQVSGQSYADFLKSEVFIPLGMTHTAAHPEDAPHLAQGYSRMFGFPLPRSQPFVPGSLTSGYMISTAEDMAKYLIAQINNRQADGSPLLQPSSLAQMRTPPAGIDSQYAMGWLVVEDGNTLAHGGDLAYFQAFMAIWLKKEIGLVFLFNQNSIENMEFENSVIRDGLVNFINGNPAKQVSYTWMGWLLVTLVAADLLNHIRLYIMIPRWVEKCSKQPRLWLWIKIAFGISIPLLILIGLPLLIKITEGGAPSWEIPFSLAPDLTGWLLVGMTLNLLRSVIHAVHLARYKTPQST